jgi:hypothetical protein
MVDESMLIRLIAVEYINDAVSARRSETGLQAPSETDH